LDLTDGKGDHESFEIEDFEIFKVIYWYELIFYYKNAFTINLINSLNMLFMIFKLYYLKIKKLNYYNYFIY
jgi:hypothetical protein